MVVGEAPDRIRELIGYGAALRHARRRDRSDAGRRAQPSPDRPCAGRRHRPGSDAGDGRACPLAAERADLGIDLYDRPVDARGVVPRRPRLEPQPRQDLRLGEADHSGHRGRGAALPRDDQPRDRHGRRACHRISRRGRSPRHGIRPIPSDGAVYRRQRPPPYFRGRPRRRGLPSRCDGQPLHGRLRPSDGAGAARCREPRHHDTNGENATSVRLPRSVALARASRRRAVSSHPQGVPPSSDSISPAT